MEQPKVTPEKVIMAYVATRDKIEAIEKEAKAKVAEEAKFQGARERWLQQYLEDNHLKNVATNFGTAFPALKESVTVGDWDAIIDELIVDPVADAISAQFSVVDERYDALKKTIRSVIKLNFLNRAINKTAVLEVMGELVEGRRTAMPPNGVNYSATREIQIRRPS